MHRAQIYWSWFYSFCNQFSSPLSSLRMVNYLPHFCETLFWQISPEVKKHWWRQCNPWQEAATLCNKGRSRFQVMKTCCWTEFCSWLFKCTMGCIKSKDAFAGSNAIRVEGSREGEEGCSGEKSSLIAGMVDEKGPSSAIVLDYAHRLSHEIVDQAVKQWAVTESKYSDIPFIESDVPWAWSGFSERLSASSWCLVLVQFE